jgi:tetratricopeptide (TPR) repeat protein
MFTQDLEAFGGTVCVQCIGKVVRLDLVSDPNGPNPVVVAIERLKNGEFEKGIRLLELLLRLDSECVEVLYNLGMALSETGRQSEALVHLNRAVDILPTHNNARNAIGVALSRQQKHHEAIAIFEQVVRVDPQHLWGHRNLAGCLLKLGDADGAIRHFARAVSLNPRDPIAVRGLQDSIKALKRH